ncbi:MAG TPA: L,D-transpeptidase [Acidimicrobiia bacterium]
MRRAAFFVVLCVAVIACGRDLPQSIESRDTPTTTTSEAAPRPSSTTSSAPAVIRPAPVALAAWEAPEGASLVVRANADVDVYAEPGDAEPWLTLEATTILGTATVLTVREHRDDGWAKVMLPIRPNGSEGWVDIRGMLQYVVPGRLVIDLSDRSLTYYELGEEVLSTTVAVGSPRNPTPTGEFFVTDNVTLSDPSSPWGPHAFGLSARSETITEYNGGDGIIGIHGTNKPGSIGNAASLGCVRVHNEVIAELHRIIPLGTPVEIRV